MSEPGTDSRLEHDLHALVRGVEPSVPPSVAAAGDLARGRRRLRRRRGAVVGGVVATVLVVAGSAVTLPGVLSAGTPAPDPATSPTPAAEERVTERPVTPRPGGARIEPDPLEVHAPVLKWWNAVLAEYVDPRRDHLSPWDGGRRNVQLSGSTGMPQVLGTRFEWTEPGREQLAMLQLEVARDRSELGWHCDPGSHGIEVVDCSGLPAPPGIRAVEVASLAGDVVAVAAEHDDGEMVALTFSPWYANNSLTPLETEPPPLETMAAAVADPRFTLSATVMPSPSRGEAMVGRAREVFAAEGLGVELAMVDVSQARGVLTATGLEIHLGWSIHPVAEGAPALEELCLRGVHRDCVVRRVGGREVLVATHRAGPRSVSVVHRGSAAWAEVVMHRVRGGSPLPVEAAVELVLDPRWQDD